MNVRAIRKLRAKLSADLPVHGLWMTMESPSFSDMAVGLGLDWLLVDAEHGHLDWQEIAGHIRAAVRSDTVVLVRLAELNAGLVKRALDLGADGIMIPWIETEEQLARTVSFAHYPPQGIRGVGGERATGWGQCLAEHAGEANEHVLVVPMIESVAAGESIDRLCKVPGVELFFLGPADYSATAGHRGEWEGPGVGAELLSIKDCIRTHGKHCGIMATSPENLLERQGQGFRMLALGSDAGLFLRGVHAALGAAGQDRRLRASFIPEDSPLPAQPIPRPPAAFRPDRLEVMSEPGKSAGKVVYPGVVFDCLVGSHVLARNLTTGIVDIEARATIEPHTHPFAEAVTVLVGSMVVSVEGRSYELGPLDTIVIPGGLVHTAWNRSGAPAVLHAAFPADTPVRSDDSRVFKECRMPDDSTGTPGKEHVIRFATAPRFAAGPGTSFIDFFNQNLVPGVAMSGGFGLFEPGGRLPAHFHNFDESICIIEGAASCVVEGRCYRLSGRATALQPRGRVHYFINESQEPMAMIWVYAGPLPERIVVDERCATTEGDPWREPAARS